MIDLRKKITPGFDWIRRPGAHETQGLTVAIGKTSARVTVDGTTYVVDHQDLPAAWDTPIDSARLRAELVATRTAASIVDRTPIHVARESSSPFLQSLKDLMTAPRASQSFNVAQARAHLTTEAHRLRLGAGGGYGGLSPEALTLADAIDRVLNATVVPDGRSLEAAKHLTAEARRLRSGAGGHGGLSPKALELADAIDHVLTSTVKDPNV